MTPPGPGHDTDNVIDLFSGKPYSHRHDQRIIRLAPELDGLEMIYTNDSHPDRHFTLKVLCWGLRADGEVVGLVPWLNGITACPDLQDPLHGHWEGYFDAGIDEVFFDAPLHKVVELESAAEYYDFEWENDNDILQEIPDPIGTHAVLSGDGFKTLTLKEVISWRLFADGTITGMLIDDSLVVTTPVLPGDACLFPSDQHSNFHYYFQHHIANRIKARDPEAIAAISQLVET